jgi:hypothetical protein
LARCDADDRRDSYRHSGTAQRQVVEWMEKVSDDEYQALPPAGKER